MKAIYDKVSADCSRLITRSYSTSFSLGIRFLNRRFRQPVYSIYGFVRLADEIVDSFHDYNRDVLLRKFREDSENALRDRISLNPVLNSFQETVHRFGIEWELIDTFLKSMETDLVQVGHDKTSYDTYILGSAEVVGLMCLRIFTDGDADLYNKLAPFAQKLGSAFQKVNFLRDLNADYGTLGRVYFPNVNIFEFKDSDKKEIEREIECEFKEALQGIRQLPGGARNGVYLAYYYYKKLFQRIRRTKPERILSDRIRIPDMVKFVLMFKSYIRLRLNYL